jgi:hypothetical protein
MTEHNDKVSRDIARVTARVGRGRDRQFANFIDLSPEGVAKWRAEMGLPPLPTTRPEPKE